MRYFPAHGIPALYRTVLHTSINAYSTFQVLFPVSCVRRKIRPIPKYFKTNYEYTEQYMNTVNVPWFHVQSHTGNITLCWPFVTDTHVKSTPFMRRLIISAITVCINYLLPYSLVWRYGSINLCSGDSCGVSISAGL
jgi:hypothetical protein